MKSKLGLAIVCVLFAAPLSMQIEEPTARDAGLVSRSFADAQQAKQKCSNTCRVRYRDCRNLKQIPSGECQYIYQDCMRFTCSASPA